MLKTLFLILPVLVPSWRFFKTVEPSPRVHWALEAEPDRWHRYRARPDRLGLLALVGRLVWNPRWNETLYTLSCAERYHLDPCAHSHAQIAARVGREICRSAAAPVGAPFRFRLVFVQRVGGQMAKDVVFVSGICAVPECAAC